MRWICPKCSRSVSFGVEECPHCAEAPEPESRPAKPGKPRRVVMGREITSEDIHRAVDVVIAVALVLVVALLIWSWPDLVAW